MESSHSYCSGNACMYKVYFTCLYTVRHALISNFLIIGNPLGYSKFAPYIVRWNSCLQSFSRYYLQWRRELNAWRGKQKLSKAAMDEEWEATFATPHTCHFREYSTILWRKNMADIWLLYLLNIIQFWAECSNRGRFKGSPNTLGFNFWAQSKSTVHFLKICGIRFSISWVQNWLFDYWVSWMHSFKVYAHYTDISSLNEGNVSIWCHKRVIVSTKNNRIHPLQTMNACSQSGNLAAIVDVFFYTKAWMDKKTTQLLEFRSARNCIWFSINVPVCYIKEHRFICL